MVAVTMMIRNNTPIVCKVFCQKVSFLGTSTGTSLMMAVVVCLAFQDANSLCASALQSTVNVLSFRPTFGGDSFFPGLEVGWVRMGLSLMHLI